jgi:hypothetical protein
LKPFVFDEGLFVLSPEAAKADFCECAFRLDDVSILAFVFVLSNVISIDDIGICCFVVGG